MNQHILDFKDYLSSPKIFEDALHNAGGKSIHSTHFFKCLGHLLYGLKWHGEIWHLTEALPHFVDEYDLVNFLNTLSNLGYKPNLVELNMEEIDSRLLPCIFIPHNSPQTPFVILKQTNHMFEVFDSSTNKITSLTHDAFLHGEAYFFTPTLNEQERGEEASSAIDPNHIRWFKGIVYRFKPQIKQGMILTFMITFFSIFSSIFIMNMYDKVIYIHSPETIKYLVSGILLVIGFEYYLRQVRLRIFTWTGTRLAAIIAPLVFERIISLPAKLSESGTIISQLGRARDFEGIRNIFSGALILNIIEIPFSIIMLFAIYLMGGELVIIPILLIILFTLLFFILIPIVRDAVDRSSETKRNVIIVNTINKLKFLKKVRNNKPWLEQNRIINGKDALASFKSTFLNSAIESIGYAFYVISGFSTMWYGVYLVLDDKISSGALIACMLLIWRLLVPFQTCLSSISVFIHLKKSIIQTHHLLMMPPEILKIRHPAPIPQEISPIGLFNVLLRHYNQPLIIFNGLNLTIKPGELFMVTGRNGSGKTTLLKLLDGIYEPQAGSIRLNDIDIRQFNLSEYRRSLGYVPEKADLFYGTVIQNLQISNPAATLENITEVLKKLGCYDDFMSFRAGLNHHIEEYKSDEIPDTLKYQLCLARAILRDPMTFLIDEAPHNYVNSIMNQHLTDYLQEQKGKKTIVMVAKSERMLQMADRVLFLLGDGRAVVGKPQEIIDYINKQSSFTFY